MNVIQISYRRVKNLGNYETVTVEITASVDERIEIPEQVHIELAEMAKYMLEREN